MTDREPDRSESGEDILAPAERDLLHRTLRPRRSRDVEGAMAEVERDIALEDILIVLMDSAATAAKEFFDMLIQVVAPDADRPDGDREEKEHRDE